MTTRSTRSAMSLSILLSRWPARRWAVEERTSTDRLTDAETMRFAEWQSAAPAPRRHYSPSCSWRRAPEDTLDRDFALQQDWQYFCRERAVGHEIHAYDPPTILGEDIEVLHELVETSLW